MRPVPSAYEGDVLGQLHERLVRIANTGRMRRVAAALNDNPDGVYQELALAVVSSCREWASRKGEATEPDIGFVVTGLNFRIGKLYRSAVRHGMPADPLHEEHPDLSLVIVEAGDNARPDAGIVASDQQRGVTDVCWKLRQHQPDGYALLEAHAQGTLPSPMPTALRSRLYRERTQARRFLEILGIRSMSDVDDNASPRIPAPPSVTV